MTDHILVEKQGAVQIIRINRAEKKNALTDAMYTAIVDGFEAGEADPEVKVQLITGSNGVFTAGNDIKEFLEASQSPEPIVRDGVSRWLQNQFDWKKPILAAVDGLAVGIGTTLLFHCDMVFASDTAKFSTPFVNLGLTPENASSALFPTVMGHQRAFEMLALGEFVDAQWALEAGFVNKVLPAADLETYALDVANKLAAKPQSAVQQAKSLLKQNNEVLREVIKKEMVIFRDCLKSDEANAALQAFLSK